MDTHTLLQFIPSIKQQMIIMRVEVQDELHTKEEITKMDSHTQETVQQSSQEFKYVNWL